LISQSRGLGDVYKRQRLGKAGKQTIEKRFSVNALKSTYLKLFCD
jgi:hypothetical protein